MCLGIPGRIVEITHAGNKLALVDVLGVQREINIACIVNEERPVHACVGDWVLVHVGFAMSRIDEREARLTLEVLQMLGEAQTEIDAMRASDRALASETSAPALTPTSSERAPASP
ncbi:MAG: HypC/HybG/HupF family hydrogenase formation chaperone [Rubrivivax sp.]